MKKHKGRLALILSCGLFLVGCTLNKDDKNIDSGNKFTTSGYEQTQQEESSDTEKPVSTSTKSVFEGNEDPFGGTTVITDTGKSHKEGWEYVTKIGFDGNNKIVAFTFDYEKNGEWYSEVSEDKDVFKKRVEEYKNYVEDKQNVATFYKTFEENGETQEVVKSVNNILKGLEEDKKIKDKLNDNIKESRDITIQNNKGNTDENVVTDENGVTQNTITLDEGQEVIGVGDNGIGIKTTEGIEDGYE